jgi:hypothetical protein
MRVVGRCHRKREARRYRLEIGRPQQSIDLAQDTLDRPRQFQRAQGRCHPALRPHEKRVIETLA